MSVSGVSLSTGLYETNGLQMDSRRKAFEQLGQALKSGDLTAAQQAYDALTQKASNASQAQNGSVAQDMTAIGQALKSGDLSAAQTAFVQLQQDLQSAQQSRHHHHHHHNVDGSQDSNASSNAGSGSSSAGSSSQSVDEGINLTM